MKDSLSDKIIYTKISYIKKIIDEDEWYCIFAYRMSPIYIQKNWIKEGTIEEFEEYFKDKIIKKYPKDKKEKSIE